jgi:NADH-quinone oxidoreductase subunit N
MPVVFFMAVGSMVFGALAAYNQRGFKRFLAYSAIGHVGYLLIGFSCSTLSGVQGILVYTMVYVVTSLLVWGILLCLSGQSGQKTQYISELVGLGATQPALAMTLSVCFLSMAGIPPLAGFYAKYLVSFLQWIVLCTFLPLLVC